MDIAGHLPKADPDVTNLISDGGARLRFRVEGGEHVGPFRRLIRHAKCRETPSHAFGLFDSFAFELLHGLYTAPTLDPENKYLSHSFVESPDMKNIYDGVAVFDQAGEAIVTLPDWFEALNEDFRYQLTPIGAAFVPFVAEEIAGNQFKIAGGIAGRKVSWQVTGIRHDAYANAHRIQVEELKPAAAMGTYLHPDGLRTACRKGWPRSLRLQKRLPRTAPRRPRRDLRN